MLDLNFHSADYEDTGFWDVTPSSSVDVHQRFGGTYGFGLLFDPEDGGSMFLRTSANFYRTPHHILEESTPLLIWNVSFFLIPCRYETVCSAVLSGNLTAL
jgi:hypothetical protein